MSEQATTRVGSDAHGERTSYGDIEVGHDLGEMEWVVSAEMVARQCALDGDYDPAFEAAEGRPQYAPPQILYRPPRWLLSRNFNIRGVLVRWDFEILAPIEVDRPMTLHGRISDKWIKAEREYVAYEVSACYQDGTPVFRTARVHLMDIIERSRPREGEGLDSGKKQERI